MLSDETSLGRLAEERLATALGWNLALFRGAPFPLPGFDLVMQAPYALENRSAFFQPGQARLTYLRLTKWLKFGNSVEQLHHLFHLATLYQIPRIVLPPSQFIQGRAVEGFEILNSASSAEPGVGLTGLFYYLDPFRLERPTQSLVSNAQRYVRPLLAGPLRAADPRVGEDDLVLHFRAGDVFRHPVAHYGQPPLAYYLAAIERERPKRTWLVFEDRANPCVDAVEAWLQKHRLEAMAQSGSLEEDLRVLLSARRLVIGHGTFGSSVAMLSARLRRLYTFKCQTWDDLPLPGVATVQAVDLAGEYTKALLSGNWKASVDQREMMLSYPAEALHFDLARAGTT
ncbi:MAG: hypothetical protein H0U23_12505 [Blastocatellia bacterium]|nr:hypothetical protein [Blastocatellia bacterium]